jgi:hypothetical protein
MDKEPTLIAPTEPVEYEITGAPEGDTTDTTDTTPKRITVPEAELQAKKLAILRQMVEVEQRRVLRVKSKAKTKAKNRRKAQLAKSSRKRNRQ